MFAAVRATLLVCAFTLVMSESTITIVYPAGGETFSSGDSVNIQWTGGEPGWPMSVYIVDVNAWQVAVALTDTAPNTGSYNWVVSVPGGLYEAYVQGNRYGDNSTWAYGEPFTVLSPPPTPNPPTPNPPTPAPTPIPPTPVPPTPIPPTPVPPTPVPPTPVPETPKPPTPVPQNHPGGCAWISNPTAATCPGWCTWNCALNLCYDAYCPQLLTPAQCSTVNGCTWYNGKCRDYNLQYGSFSNCALATSADVCGGSCQWSSYQSACISGSSSACAWLPQQSAKSCPTERCWFSAAIGYCYDPTCAAKLTSADCSSQGGCAWYNGYCYDYNLQYSGFACSKAEEVSECPSSRCHWDGTTCQNGGGAAVILPPVPHNGGCAWIPNPTAATCPSGCTFDAGLNLCYDATCPLHHTSSSCGLVSGCSWYRNQCRDYNLQYGNDNCAQSFSAATCGGNYCEWSYKQNKCLSVSPNSACAWLPQGNALTCPDRCSYTAALGFCYNSQCVLATTQCACNVLQSAACVWYNNKCLDYNLQYGSYSCSSATSKLLCGKSCVWNEAAQTCS